MHNKEPAEGSAAGSASSPRPVILTPAPSSDDVESIGMLSTSLLKPDISTAASFPADVKASAANSVSSSGRNMSALASSSEDFITVTPPAELSDASQMTLSYHDTHWDLQMTPNEKALLLPYVEMFPAYLLRQQMDNGGDSARAFSVIELALSFLDHLLQLEVPREAIRAGLQAFEREFLSDDVEIHTVVMRQDIPAGASLLKTYYATLKAANLTNPPIKPALFEATQNGDASLFAIFGGQGFVNTNCLRDLSDLFSIYGSLLEDLINVAALALDKLISLPDTGSHYENHGFNIKQWLETPETIPDASYIASAPLSFPIIGLISLSHYCITCKIIGKSPGEVRDSLQGVTGHSQGIIAAAAVARSGSWEEFYESAEIAIEMLFWIGLESHRQTPASSLSAAAIKESIEEGEGQPSPMLSIRGLSRSSIEGLIEELNKHLTAKDHIYVALVNSRDNVVVAGPPKSLRGFNLRLRKLKASQDLDQSRVPFNQRKPIVQHRFLPISAAFHTPHLEHSTKRILEALRLRSFLGNELHIPLYHTSTGQDLRHYGSHGIIGSLVRMITTEPVDWPMVCSLSEASHLLDFGPGRIGSLVHQMTEGRGTRVIAASDLTQPSKDIGSKAEIFASTMPPSAPNWEELYGPKLRKTSNGEMKLDTKMSRLLGVPPIMVAGMTPTTVPYDFVASVMRAGYHVELAGGGYSKAADFEKAIRQISENVPPGCGITCNLIYVNPKAIAWQIPLIRQLVRKGLKVDGLTIGAGIPSADVVKEYIETIDLKHISFKPGSDEAILRVIDIAKAHPDSTIGLQWTGGRSGGHHSFEDFHAPIVATYGRIRQCPNIVLIAGSGFGGASDTYPYLTGEWSRSLGYPLMPFDGILLGSRMMVAKEAHTSIQAKNLIVQAGGVLDSDWHKSYQEATGGVITVNSEMGQPIHKLATRGVLLWHELDREIFSIKDKSKRLAELKKKRANIITRLNSDFQKPWFGFNSNGQNVDIEDMTYLEVLQRLISLMYVQHQGRWIDESYERLVLDFTARTQERLAPVSEFTIGKKINNPRRFLGAFSRCYSTAGSELLHPEDVSFFIGLCKRRGQKPVNFIPRLDENFENWFKKDSLWQAEDIDAVVDQDAQRVCIIHGPVAARYSRVIDEPCQAILDDIANSHVNMLYRDFYSNEDSAISSLFFQNTATKSLSELENVFIQEWPTKTVYSFATSGALPNADSVIDHLIKDTTGWARACLAEKSVLQGHHREPNPVRSAIKPVHGNVITINYRPGKEIASVSLSTACTNTRRRREVLRLSSPNGRNITVTLFTPNPREAVRDIAIYFNFEYCPERRAYTLSEDIHGRSDRIKIFYAELWLGYYPDSLLNAGLHTVFSGGKMTLSQEMVQDFLTVIGRSDPSLSIQESVSEHVPLDICIVVAWDALVQPLLIPAMNGNLLRLLHRSNSFEYFSKAKPLQVGDVLETTSRIGAVTIQANGKLIEVVAEIRRLEEPVVKVTSTFIIQGSFTDYENTFRCTQEPEIEVFVSSEKMEALLLSRDWLDMDVVKARNLISRTFIFRLCTQATYDQSSIFSSLQVTGQVYSKTVTGTFERVGKVYFERGPCHGNPVTGFLARHGSQVHQPQPLQNPGWNGESSWKISMPSANTPYARVSRDTNPIHVCPVFSAYARLPGTVTHGMYTSAGVRRVIEKAAAEADPTRFRRYSASFEGMVLPGDEIRVEMQHVGMIDGRMVIKIQAFNDKIGEQVLEAEAEVNQPPTAYVFTGQGSQEKGMGMALYNSSPTARAVWERGDKHLLDLFGFSIIDIAWNNPKTLTVHFGGRRGRKIRENYLAMTISDSHAFEKPIVREITPTSTSYTFQDARGLLYSTQFAQPALTLMEMAAFEDMRSKGLVQEEAAFAGHSLGEYIALGGLSSFMTLESLLNVVFYRGLSMQVAMARDEEGQTDFSMVAVNPSKVGKGFKQESFENIVKMISQECQVLLEVVNYNVEGQQYVCAGHLRALWVITQVLNQLSRSAHSRALEPDELLRVVRQHVSSSSKLSRRIILERGAATIPLTGIDVPFHSTHLRDGIGPYRKFLEGKILEQNIDPDKLVGKFIPNVMGKPFSVDKAYMAEVAEVTGSEKLREMLDTWVEAF